MARKQRWKWNSPVDGVAEIELHSWKYFHDFICQKMLDYGHYIWRGHRCDSWLLEPTIDRTLKKTEKDTPETRRDHINAFKYAARGRRGPNPLIIATENEWWALGQHHGLATPLLDWTGSPFAAAYFAFIGTGPGQTKRRAIWAVNPGAIEIASRAITTAHKGVGKAPIVELVRPLSDDNPRLVNQNGLFTRAPDGVDLMSWIQNNHKGVARNILLKFTIPDTDRTEFLRSLNRMNINHLTLFPDLYGASKFSNLNLEIDKY